MENKAMQYLFGNRQGSRSTQADLINKQLEELADLSIAQLRDKWLQLHESKPPKRLSREMLTRAIAYKVQKKPLVD